MHAHSSQTEDRLAKGKVAPFRHRLPPIATCRSTSAQARPLQLASDVCHLESTLHPFLWPPRIAAFQVHLVLCSSRSVIYQPDHAESINQRRQSVAGAPFIEPAIIPRTGGDRGLIRYRSPGSLPPFSLHSEYVIGVFGQTTTTHGLAVSFTLHPLPLRCLHP